MNMNRKMISVLVLVVFAQILAGCEYDYAYSFTLAWRGPMPVIPNVERTECFVPPPGLGPESGGIRIPLNVALTFSGTGQDQIQGLAVINENGYREALQRAHANLGSIVYCLPPERTEVFGAGSSLARRAGRPSGMEVSFGLNFGSTVTHTIPDTFGLTGPSITFYAPSPWPPLWIATVDPTRYAP